jgi:hypothetical protein
MTWTPERRAKQSAHIHQWRPWAKSTGAKTPQGKAVVSRNAFKGGHRNQFRELARLINVEIHKSHELLASLRQPQKY